MNSIGVAITLLAVLGTGLLTVRVWPHQTDPEGRSLIGVGASLFACVLALLVVFGLEAIEPLGVAIPGGAARLYLLDAISAFGTILAAGSWLLFATVYTGHGRELRTPLGAVVGVFWLIAGVAAVASLVAISGGTNGPPAAGVFLGMLRFILGGLALAGVFLIMGTAVRRTAIPLPEASWFAAGTVLFAFASHAAFVYEQPLVVPVLFLLAGLCFLVAVERYPVFETVPAVRLAGRDRLIEEMDAGLLVTNRSDEVQDCNPAAARLLDLDRAAVIGRPLETVLPDTFTATSFDEQSIQTPDGRFLFATSGRVTDVDGNYFGRTILIRDVTAQRRREHRLSLLSEFLVETVRERAGAIKELAKTALEDDASSAPAGTRIRTEIVELQSLLGDIRELERTFEGSPVGHTDAVETARSVAAELESETAWSVHLDAPDQAVSVAVSPALLRAVLRICVRQYGETGDGDVAVTVERDPPAVTIASETAVSTDVDSEERERVTTIVGLAVEQVGGRTRSTTSSSHSELKLTFPRLEVAATGADPAPEARDEVGDTK